MNAAVDLSKRPGCAAAAAGARYRVVLAELSAAGAQNRAAELARVDQLRAALPDLDAAEDAAVGLARHIGARVNAARQQMLGLLVDEHAVTLRPPRPAVDIPAGQARHWSAHLPATVDRTRRAMSWLLWWWPW